MSQLIKKTKFLKTIIIIIIIIFIKFRIKKWKLVLLWLNYFFLLRFLTNSYGTIRISSGPVISNNYR